MRGGAERGVLLDACRIRSRWVWRSKTGKAVRVRWLHSGGRDNFCCRGPAQLATLELHCLQRCHDALVSRQRLGERRVHKAASQPHSTLSGECKLHTLLRGSALERAHTTTPQPAPVLLFVGVVAGRRLHVVRVVLQIGKGNSRAAEVRDKHLTQCGGQLCLDRTAEKVALWVSVQLTNLLQLNQWEMDLMACGRVVVAATATFAKGVHEANGELVSPVLAQPAFRHLYPRSRNGEASIRVGNHGVDAFAHQQLGGGCRIYVAHTSNLVGGDLCRRSLHQRSGHASFHRLVKLKHGVHRAEGWGEEKEQ